MARQCATFFYHEREPEFACDPFDLLVRYDQQRLPESSIVVGMVDVCGAMIVRLPLGLGERARTAAKLVIRKAMREIGITANFQIAEADEIWYLVDNDNQIPYLVWQDGQWQLTTEVPQWPVFPGTVFLAREPE